MQRLIGRLWGGDKIAPPRAPAAPAEVPPGQPAGSERSPAGAPAVAGPPVQHIPPDKLRFSQRSAGGNGRTERMRAYVQEHGTIPTPVDVVRTPDGLVTIDNTRVAIAREQGLSKIPARVWELTDPIPPEYQKRFGDFRNWGEVLANRVGRQLPEPLSNTGTTEIPTLRERNLR